MKKHKHDIQVFAFVQCIIKQLLDSVFVISRIIKVSVRVISLSLRLWLITLTSTLIILDITNTSSNNCLLFSKSCTKRTFLSCQALQKTDLFSIIGYEFLKGQVLTRASKFESGLKYRVVKIANRLFRLKLDTGFQKLTVYALHNSSFSGVNPLGCLQVHSAASLSCLHWTFVFCFCFFLVYRVSNILGNLKRVFF